MTCTKCGFEMTAKVIDSSITRWTCPHGHTKMDIKDRPSASKPAHVRVGESTYPDNLEHK